MFNPQDIYEIQECLCSYKVLLNWVPAISKDEVDLKYIKMQTINHLCNKCDDELERMKNE